MEKLISIKTQNIFVSVIFEIPFSQLDNWISNLKYILSQQTIREKNNHHIDQSNIFFYLKELSSIRRKKLEKLLSEGNNNENIDKIPKLSNLIIKEKNNQYIIRVDSGYIVITPEQLLIECFINPEYQIGDQNMMLIKFFLTSLFVISNDILVLHGNIVANDTNTFLILGDRKSGKTTLSLILKTAGMKWICDDIVYANKYGDYIKEPYRYYTNIRRETFKKFKHFSVLKNINILSENAERIRVHWDSMRDSEYGHQRPINKILLPNIGESYPILKTEPIFLNSLTRWELNSSIVMALLSKFEIKQNLSIKQDFKLYKINSYKIFYNYEYIDNIKSISRIINEL